MIVAPFSGSVVASDQALAYFIDGTTGMLTTERLADEQVIPSMPSNWRLFGAVDTLLARIGSVTPGITDGKAMRVSYPAQSCSPGSTYVGDTGPTAALAGQTRPAGGMHFLHPIPRCTRARLRYAVRFPVGFDWRGGGKMPGLCSASMAASGGVTDPTIAGTTSWTARMMWRPNGQITPYVYMGDNRAARWAGSGYNGSAIYPDANWVDADFAGSTLFCALAAAATNVWVPIEQELWMNTPGQANGGMRLSVGGVLIVDRSDLIWRWNDRLFIDTVFMSSFFGGNTVPNANGKINGDASIWPTSVSTTVDYSDFVVECLQLA